MPLCKNDSLVENTLQLSENTTHIHQMMKKIPQPIRNEANDNRKFSKWTLTGAALTDDIVINTNIDNTQSVNISDAAFTNANPRTASVDGKKGIYFSNRLHLALVRFVTDNGADQAKVNKILEDRYGVSVSIPDYQALTGEAASRFQTFQASELISIINMFEEFGIPIFDEYSIPSKSDPPGISYLNSLA